MTTPSISDDQPKTTGESLPATMLELIDHDGWELSGDVRVRCPECGQAFLHNKHLARIFPKTHCDSCVDAYDRQRRDQAVLATPIETTLSEIIPRLYRDTDPNRLPDEQRRKVTDWENKPKARGLWLVGDTRTGKTRTICLLLDSLIREGIEIRAFFHGSFDVDLLEVMRSQKSFRAWKRKIVKVPVVVIDDLFSTKLTERTESALFEIIDERIANYLPTFVTTQLTAKDSRGRFHSNKRFEAFFARIKEFFQIVSFKLDKQAEFEV